MIYIVIALILVFIVAVCLGVRLALVKISIRKVTAELDAINGQITQNNILRLPLPDKDVGKLLQSVNATLTEVRRERVEYILREREFRSQIESVSHDLRTPLTVIIGYLKLAQERDEIDEIILRKAESMQKLVSSFYDYSRIISGDYPLRQETTDICRIVRETFTDNCVVFENKGLKVFARFGQNAVPVSADSGALERIVANILQNASRYAHRLFEISLSTQDNVAVAKFFNDADDITEESLSHLFDRFYMADNSRSNGGTGLGLTIARNLAIRMGGNLRAYIVTKRQLPSHGTDKDDEMSQAEKYICFELSFPIFQ